MTKKQAINTTEFRKDNSVFFEIDKKLEGASKTHC